MESQRCRLVVLQLPLSNVGFPGLDSVQVEKFFWLAENLIFPGE
jgi:hypothetical protein